MVASSLNNHARFKHRHVSRAVTLVGTSMSFHRQRRGYASNDALTVCPPPEMADDIYYDPPNHGIPTRPIELQFDQVGMLLSINVLAIDFRTSRFDAVFCA